MIIHSHRRNLSSSLKLKKSSEKAEWNEKDAVIEEKVNIKKESEEKDVLVSKEKKSLLEDI